MLTPHKYLLSGFVLLLLQAFSNTALAQPKLLENEWRRVLAVHGDISRNDDPFAVWKQASFWQALPHSLQQAYLAEAETLLEKPYPVLPASIFLDYVKNGNRSRYEGIYFERRNMLHALILAECFERKGRFLEKIADGIWMICEETYWGIPAHLTLQKAGTGLPDVTEPTMDLFAGETAALLAVAHYLLADRLNTLSPMLSSRMVYEIDRRVLTPNLTRTDYWWMGYEAARNNGMVNNWNPWCNSNWLLAVMLVEKDAGRKQQAMEKIVGSLDIFVNSQHADGGCDEGPGYWSRAGGSLFDALELLYLYTGGKYNVYANALIQNVGAYIYKVHIADRYFVNFADAALRPELSAATVFTYGKRIANDTMQALAKQGLDLQHYTSKVSLGINGLPRNMLAFTVLPEMLAFDKQPGKAPFYWLPNLQVMVARKELPNGQSLFVGAKGGHNAESHNHNDIGNFIVYADGNPVLIDVGVESYTAKTFSAQRYTIWTMQSQYHNVPTINGVQQRAGKSFTAKGVEARQLTNGGSFMLDMAGAYPAEAAVKEWKRKIVLDNVDRVVWTDQYSLAEVKGATQFHLMTQVAPQIQADGIHLQSSAFNLLLSYDSKRLEASIEKVEITDTFLKSNWGEAVYRITLTVKAPVLKGNYTFTLSRKAK